MRVVISVLYAMLHVGAHFRVTASEFVLAANLETDEESWDSAFCPILSAIPGSSVLTLILYWLIPIHHWLHFARAKIHKNSH